MDKSWPVYVTRPTSDGYIMALWMNGYIVLPLFALIVLNTTFWLVIGLVEAILITIGAF